MKQKKILLKLWGITTAGTLLFSSQSVLSQSLNEVVAQTIKTNPEVLIDTNSRLALNETVKQARAGYYPKVDLNLGIGKERADNPFTRPDVDTLTRGESGLALTQMLYDGYATKSSVDQTEFLVESAAYQVADTSEQIGLDSVDVYLAVLRRQELLKLAEINLTAHEEAFKQIELRAYSGTGRKVDLYQADARLSLAKTDLYAAQGNLEDAQSNYLRVIGNAPENLYTPEEKCCEVFPNTLDDAVQIALANHPAMQSSIANYEADLAQIQGAKAPMQPRFDIDLDVIRDNNVAGLDGHDDTDRAMLRMRYNLYRGGADKAHISETQYLSQESKELIESTKREVESKIRLSWNALDIAILRLPSLKTHADSTEKARDAYIKQFRVGQRTLLDVLDSERELFISRSDYVDGEYNERIARYRLMADMGSLLETLGIARPEESKLDDEEQ